MSTQLLPVPARASNGMNVRLSQWDFESSSWPFFNNPNYITNHRGAGWGFGFCPASVDAGAAIGYGRDGSIVPTDYLIFHLDLKRYGTVGFHTGARASANFGRSAGNPNEFQQTRDFGPGSLELGGFSMCPGWNWDAPPAGTELWAPRWGIWQCDLDYTYSPVNLEFPFANVDLLYRSLGFTIADQSQTPLPASHYRTSAGSMSVSEETELLAHPLWLFNYNLYVSFAGTSFNEDPVDTEYFSMDATFQRLGA